jgi:1,2-diacylglycerol 3-beta-galactosyltransferase
LKRVLILTADSGFGHRSAANAIAAALEDAFGSGCLPEIVNPLDEPHVPPFLRRSQSDYDRSVRKSPTFYRLSYKASEARLPGTVTEAALTVLLFDSLREIVRRHEPDAIVSTHPFFAHPLAAWFAVERRRVPFIVVVTDLAAVHRIWFQKAVDLCLVPTYEARDLALAAGLAADQVRITGVPIHPRLVDGGLSREAARSRLGVDPDRMTILAVGSKRTRRFLDPLRALNHSGLSIQILAVAGGDHQLFQKLQQMEWHVPARVYNFVEDMAPLLMAADCVLSKAGGLIVSESLACGLPLLMVDVLPGQEEGNAAYVIQGGAGEQGSDSLRALEVLYHWLEDGGALLRQRARNASLLGRPYAAYEVADLAWLAAHQGTARPRGRRLPSRTRVIDMLRRHAVDGR